MGNFTGKYLKVWKVEEKSGYKFVDIGDGEKQKDGTRKFFTWFGCILLGEAANKNFNEGDLVEITSAMITMEKYNDKWSPKLKIFHLHHIDSDGNRTEDPPKQGESRPFESYEGKKETTKKQFGNFVPGGGNQSPFDGPEKFKDDIPF